MPRTAPRTLHLSAALDAPTAADTAAALTADHWLGLVRLAERGTLDFVTLADSLAPPPDGSPGRLDAVAVLSRVAPVTSGIGLVPTVTTTHTEPFHTSTALATLDWVSEGRAGWLVEVSTGEADARAVGRRDPAPAAELWAEAADAAEVAVRLWDSWEDDAEIRSVATGRFVDRDKLHYIDFEGPHFSVRGPSIVPRPPQGRPPIVIALDAQDTDSRWEPAVAHADAVLLDAAEPSEARLAAASLRARAAEAGRDPAALRVLVRTAVDLSGEAATGAGLRYQGDGEGLAALLADWAETPGVDGFHLLPAAPAQLAAVAEETVPALRGRGLFRTAYDGTTLRDRLGLARPASRYARTPETAR